MLLKDVSLATGFSTGYISRIENGSSTPSAEVLIKLCNVYEIDVKNYADDIDIEKKVKIELKDLVLGNEVFYNGKELEMRDKLNLLRFAEIIMSYDEIDYKNICEKSLEYLDDVKNLFGRNDNVR